MAEYGERTAVVLDEQPIWLEALEQVLRRVGVDVVGKATRPEDALALVAEHKPDVLLIEFGFSDGEVDAAACLRRMRKLHPTLKAMALSPRMDPEEAEAAFEAGASVYCAKTAGVEDLEVAIRQVFENSIYVAHRVTAAEVAVSSNGRPATDDLPDLTPRELEILQLVAEGYSNSQLAKMLWVTEQTVKFHLSNVYRKLGVSNRTEASRWAHRRGLLSEASAA
jgi:DNA-binding NarL/FixJ family response regulator